MHDRLCPDCEPFEPKTVGMSRHHVVQSVEAAAVVAAMPESPAMNQRKTLSFLYEPHDEAGRAKACHCSEKHDSAFVWHRRGSPHVPAWASFAVDPGVKLNARG
jgi:hypothetical protein